MITLDFSQKWPFGQLTNEFRRQVTSSVLRPHKLSGDHNTILARLVRIRKSQYARAIPFIDAFSHTDRAVAVWIDGELNALKLEIERLEQEVRALETEKTGIETMLLEFSTQHTLRLGDLITRLLERYREQASTDDEYAQADYEQYTTEADQAGPVSRCELTAGEQRELTRKFRKAAQLCHPDVVAIELKSKAEAIFGELKAANDRHDLHRVSELLHLLEGNTFLMPRSQPVTSKDLLKGERIRLQTVVGQLQNILLTLRQSDMYQTISQITNWDAYFTATRQQLEAHLEGCLTFHQ